ncbi:uncharacterized protein LOC117787942 [Drosophila innubila]|uniref:uncharacterized protein LOC117787942 n=1 Tax=Drosophila innubila TaxID=198719 RepID=UPI00148D00E5|nr:uncharacterized protein LOC117787942 [Drosophila innubila]
MIHVQVKRMEVRVVLLLWMINLAAGKQANNNWQYNGQQYDNAQYAKLFGQVTGSNPAQEHFGPFQYQYVDYQPNCKSGGQPVCATNGMKYFYFENDCKLEAHNIKSLFQYGTELEPTELERCMPNCANIECTTKYAPVCAAPETGPHQGQGVTYANECEVRRRECITKETQKFLNDGPCRQLKSTSKSKSKSKGKRKHRRRGTSTTTTTATPIANSTIKEEGSKTIFVKLSARTEALRREATTTTKTTTTTTTPAPMQFHKYLSNTNPGVSVSQAVNAYSVYNIPDMGDNYAEIMDSNLSLYLPGFGIVTDTPPKTTSIATTTTSTTTPKPTNTTLPSTNSTTQPITPKEIIILLPYNKTSTPTQDPSTMIS